jgi:hypothetical protein
VCVLLAVPGAGLQRCGGAVACHAALCLHACASMPVPPCLCLRACASMPVPPCLLQYMPEITINHALMDTLSGWCAALCCAVLHCDVLAVHGFGCLATLLRRRPPAQSWPAVLLPARLQTSRRRSGVQQTREKRSG